MSQVLLTGATGLVGGHLLRMLLNAPAIKSIAAPTRRPLADIAGAAVFLASPAAAYVHGAVLNVDGGWLAR